MVCPLYGTTMWLIQDAQTWRRCLDYLGLEFNGEANGKALLAAHDRTGEMVMLVGVFNGELSTLVHECDHVAFWILHHVGVKLQNNGANESHAYLVQTLFELFFPLLEIKP